MGSSPASTEQMSRRRPQALPAPGAQRLCERCGATNLADASSCSVCGGSRLAPPWVLARAAVSRRFEARVTLSSERFGEPRQRITLSKWWPGMAAARPTLHINTPEEWSRLREIVEHEFGPRLGWRILAPRASLPVASLSDEQLRELIRQHPELAREVLEDELDGGAQAHSRNGSGPTIGGSGTPVATGELAAYGRLVAQLPRQGRASLIELERILESWSIHQLGRVLGEVRPRLETIALFERMVLDPRTFEIRGEHSIHRLLEGAMWIVDEHYWLMTSNRALRTLIGRAIARDHPRESGLRPDFACAQLGSEGVIIEIKRPAHRLTVADLNQAERYLVLAERYAHAMTWKATLIGQTATDDAWQTAKHRPSVEIRTFAELLASARQRYEQYLRSARRARSHCGGTMRGAARKPAPRSLRET